MVLTLTANLEISNEENFKLRQSNISFFIEDNCYGKGNLFIGENRLSWIREDKHGLAVEYPNISFHAISKDPATFVHPCIHLMVQSQASGVETDESLEATCHESQDVYQVRLVPEDEGTLEEMFRAISACQVLHPDPFDAFSDDEDFFGSNMVDDDEFGLPARASRNSNGNQSDRLSCIVRELPDDSEWEPPIIRPRLEPNSDDEEL